MWPASQAPFWRRSRAGICRQIAWQNRLPMLDAFDSPAPQFEKGRNAGREEERNRVVRTFHEEVSSSMIAALFLIETVKSELEDAGLPQAEALSKASDILAETSEKKRM